MRRMESVTVQISEPGRTPLQVRLHRPLEVGRDCDGVLLTDALLCALAPACEARLRVG